MCRSPGARPLISPSCKDFTSPAGECLDGWRTLQAKGKLTTQAGRTTVLQGEGHFSVGVNTTPVAGVFSVQGYKNGTAILEPQQQHTTYPLLLTPVNNGARFSVQARTGWQLPALMRTQRQSGFDARLCLYGVDHPK